jgi:dsDNA-binding SOS-regulon protein
VPEFSFDPTKIDRNLQPKEEEEKREALSLRLSRKKEVYVK